MNVLITGAAGFIGYHLVKELTLNKKNKIYGIDNLLADENINYKKKRLKILEKNKNFYFKKIDITNFINLEKVFKKCTIDYIINLAALAGVRKSIDNPSKYFDVNIKAYMNVLLLSKKYNIKHLLHASSSSVYGDCDYFPQKENFECEDHSSFYGASKKINENMSYVFSKNYNLPITCLRFFTVYGPFSRKDMAIYKFVNSAVKNKEITLHNNGIHYRDFTYVTDVINYIIKLIPKASKNKIKFNLFNIGSGESIKLINLIKIIEKKLNKKIKVKKVKKQEGDVLKTHSSINKINKYLDYNKQSISIEKGIEKYIDWYKSNK